MTAAGAVLLDLDGVLVDSRHAFATSVNAALAAHGLPARAPETLHRFLGPPTHEIFETLVGDGGAVSPDALVQAYRDRYRRTMAAESTLFDGIPDVLAVLAARVPLVVATSKPQPLAAPLLEALGVARFFAAIVGPSLEARNEPKRETLVRALAALPGGSGPPVMVGDRRHDVEAAHAHGLRCIGALWGVGGEAELRAAGADDLAAAPADLPRLLGLCGR